MGVSSSKMRINGGLCEKGTTVLKREKEEEEGSEKPMFEKARVRASRETVRDAGHERGAGVSYEREMMAFAFKKAEWKQERRRLREEVKALRAAAEERERERREKGHVDHHAVLAEERVRRDETVEKWKQLYLAIKMELDDLILRTHEGGLCWRAEEEDMAEEQRKRLKAKEETIKELRSKVASMEQEMVKRDREVDILRQSLRIMSSKKIYQPKNQPKKVIAKQCGKIHVK